MKFESEIIKFLQSNISTGWLDFFQFVTMLGSFLGFFITLIFVIIKNRKQTLSLIIAFALGSLFNHILKAIIKRNRPFDTYSDIFNYGGESGYSMPSGHSFCVGVFASFCIYTLFVYTKNAWKRGLGSAIISLSALTVMLSRMVLGAHFLTDTLLGITLGIMFAVGVIIINNVIIKKYNLYKRKDE